MNKKEILERINKSGIIEKYVRDGIFGKKAKAYLEDNWDTGVLDRRICIDTDTEDASGIDLQKVRGLLMAEFGSELPIDEGTTLEYENKPGVICFTYTIGECSYRLGFDRDYKIEDLGILAGVRNIPNLLFDLIGMVDSDYKAEALEIMSVIAEASKSCAEFLNSVTSQRLDDGEPVDHPQSFFL
jgi:hypothetical protein